MKQGIVKFSKEFITPTGLKEWLSLEWDVNEPFDEARAMETFMKVKEFVCNSQPSSQGLIDNSIPPGPPPVINVQRTSEDIRIAELVADILKCTSLEGDNGLYSYQKLSATCKEAGIAYSTMYNKLSKLKNNATY